MIIMNIPFFINILLRKTIKSTKLKVTFKMAYKITKYLFYVCKKILETVFKLFIMLVNNFTF